MSSQCGKCNDTVPDDALWWNQVNKDYPVCTICIQTVANEIAWETTMKTITGQNEITTGYEASPKKRPWWKRFARTK